MSISDMSFAESPIFETLFKEIFSNLAAQGITKPTPIQQESFKPILEGKDLIAQSRTGSGKTLAFSLPAFSHLEAHKPTGVRFLVLTPTRELAQQIADVFEKTYAFLGFRTLAITGGKSYRYQTSQIARGIDAIVATPGRLTDLLDQKILDLKQLEILVLDEMDEMLDFGFADDILNIKKAIGKKVQTLLFSATFPPKVSNMAKQMVESPYQIKVLNTDVSNGQIEHEFIEVRIGKNLDALLSMLLYYNPEHAIVFCKTREETKQIQSALFERGFAAGVLNGEMTQEDRSFTMNRFKNKQLKILVATDVAARGIDVTGLSHVINYSVPTNVEAYTHRTGRTGRAGASGKAWTVVPYNERREYQFVCSKVNINPTRISLPDTKKLASHFVNNMICKIREEKQTTPEYVENAVNQHIEDLSHTDLRFALQAILKNEATRQLGNILKTDDISPAVATEFGSKIKPQYKINDGYREQRSYSSPRSQNGGQGQNRGRAGGGGGYAAPYRGGRLDNGGTSSRQGGHSRPYGGNSSYSKRPS